MAKCENILCFDSGSRAASLPDAASETSERTGGPGTDQNGGKPPEKTFFGKHPRVAFGHVGHVPLRLLGRNAAREGGLDGRQQIRALLVLPESRGKPPSTDRKQTEGSSGPACRGRSLAATGRREASKGPRHPHPQPLKGTCSGVIK